MNKMFFLGMFAAAGMLLATSCSNDDLIEQASGNTATVSFSLATEGAPMSRAISDGSGAKKLVYAVYNANSELIDTISGADANGQFVNNNAFDNGLTETVNITLAKGQQYTVVFWAQNPNCTSYTTTDLKNVTVDYAGLNNDETRDAFFKAETFTVSRDAEIDVTLKRPFAQINVGITDEDYQAAKESGIEIEKSAVAIKNAATSINLLNGRVSGETEVYYSFATVPAKFDTPEDLSVTVNNTTTKYKWLSMSYILVNDENGGDNKATLESDGLKFTFKPASGSEIVFDEGLNNVPVQRNWRTNILGELLTGDIQFKITIDPIYAGDYNSPEFEPIAEGVSYDAMTSTFFLTSKAGLIWFAKQTNTANSTYGDFKGKTVKLTTDVDLNNDTWTPIGTQTAFWGIFDGGNNTISNLTVNVTDDNNAAGLFARAIGTVKNVKLSNVNITGHYKAGAIVGDALCSLIENCHVDGGTITSTPNNDKDNANHVGGIAGYLSAEPNAWVKNSSVKNLTIMAYRNVGGVVGTANGSAIVLNNSIDNVNVIADQLVEYKEPTKADEPKNVLGCNKGAATESNNICNNVAVYRYYINNQNEAFAGTDKGLTYAANKNVNTINLYDGEYDINNCKQKTLTIVGTKNVIIKVVGEGQEEGKGQIDYGLDGSSVTFKGITIKTNNQTYAGYARLNANYIGCAFDNCYCLNGYSSFTDCTFDVSGDQYNIWTWGAPKATFNKCTFNSDGKAMLLYGTVNTELTIENSVFKDKGGLSDKKAAIEIGNDYDKSYTVVVNNTIVNGYEINDKGINTGTTLWANKNSMETDKLSVTVDGVKVY